MVKANPCPGWPELLKPATAAAMLDLAESTFRAIYPALVARHGLKVIGLAGPKFDRSNLLATLGRLSDRGLDIRADKASGTVWIGAEEFHASHTRSGKTRRGCCRRAVAPPADAGTPAGGDLAPAPSDEGKPDPQGEKEIHEH